MCFQSKCVSRRVCILLIELTLVLQSSLCFFFLDIYTFLVWKSLFHIHGVCPISFTFENRYMEIFFVFRCLLKWHYFICILLFLALSCTTLLQIPQCLSKPVHLPDTIVMISSVITVPQSILILCTFDQKKGVNSIWLEWNDFLFRCFFHYLILFSVWHLKSIIYFIIF